MGLDSVTIAMEVEAAFRLEPIEGMEINTAGELHRYVCELVRNGPVSCVSQRLFYALRRLLMRKGIGRNAVRLDSEVVCEDLDWFALEWEVGCRLRRPAPRSWRAWLGFGRDSWMLRDLVMALRSQLDEQDWFWTERRIWARVVSILSDVLGVPAELIRPESDLVADLGAC